MNLRLMTLAGVLVVALAVLSIACTPEETTGGDGTPIGDLITQGEVEVKAAGAGISEATVEVRRLADRDVAVVIPAGTLLVPESDVQTMITTADERVVLEDDDWTAVTVSVLCTNIHLPVPDETDVFTIAGGPEDEELQTLMLALKEEDAPPEVLQAATWIVTDNADFEDLGILVSEDEGSLLRHPRVIGPKEAARGMKIVDDAGIAINRRAIWRDRDRILEFLEDDDLRRWLQDRSAVDTPMDPTAGCVQYIDQLPGAQVLRALGATTAEEMCDLADDPETCSDVQAGFDALEVYVDLQCPEN